MHHWLTMNAFEPLLWMGCVWCVVRAINLGQPQYWFCLGVITGVGLETKHSIAFLVFDILVGALFGTERPLSQEPVAVVGNAGSGDPRNGKLW